MQHLLPKVERILEISRELNALKFGEFQLSSGAKSHYYFDGRLLTLHPDGAKAVAEVVLAITLEAGAILSQALQLERIQLFLRLAC